MEKEKIVPYYFRGTNYLEPTKQYHSTLPDDIKHLYCYLSDAGHNILALIEGRNFEEAPQLVDKLCPCPVKTVLRKYRMYEGFPVVACEYDEQLGLLPPDEDSEY